MAAEECALEEGLCEAGRRKAGKGGGAEERVEL